MVLNGGFSSSTEVTQTFSLSSFNLTQNIWNDPQLCTQTLLFAQRAFSWSYCRLRRVIFRQHVELDAMVYIAEMLRKPEIVVLHILNISEFASQFSVNEWYFQRWILKSSTLHQLDGTWKVKCVKSHGKLSRWGSSVTVKMTVNATFLVQHYTHSWCLLNCLDWAANCSAFGKIQNFISQNVLFVLFQI